jgi:hypothetical protein
MLASKADGGSDKSLRSTTIENGVRSMVYMQFQVSRDADGKMDALIALYIG